MYIPDTKTTFVYDDGNLPEIDLPGTSSVRNTFPQEFDSGAIPKEEDTRPRKDGPGGE